MAHVHRHTYVLHVHHGIPLHVCAQCQNSIAWFLFVPSSFISASSPQHPHCPAKPNHATAFDKPDMRARTDFFFLVLSLGEMKGEGNMGIWVYEEGNEAVTRPAQDK
jgi:hypothetical protein